MILAFGGFSADVGYRTRLDPKLTGNLKTTNQPGATAELMREASRIGANIIQADWIQFLPNTSPDEEGMGMGSHFASVGGSLYGLWINTKTASVSTMNSVIAKRRPMRSSKCWMPEERQSP